VPGCVYLIPADGPAVRVPQNGRPPAGRVNVTRADRRGVRQFADRTLGRGRRGDDGEGDRERRVEGRTTSVAAAREGAARYRVRLDHDRISWERLRLDRKSVV